MIRKFLDAQRIHNLTAYLQTLHRQSLANADHTTLLLNCYTKLKDSLKLEEFIKVQGGGGGGCGVFLEAISPGLALQQDAEKEKADLIWESGPSGLYTRKRNSLSH